MVRAITEAGNTGITTFVKVNLCSFCDYMLGGEIDGPTLCSLTAGQAVVPPLPAAPFGEHPFHEHFYADLIGT
jgi:hypothetical protein